MCRQTGLDRFVDLGPCILGSLARLPVWRIPGLLLAALAGAAAIGQP